MALSGPSFWGAGLLFLTNLAAVVASALLVFLLVRMDAPDVREEIGQSIRDRGPAASSSCFYNVPFSLVPWPALGSSAGAH